MKLLYCIYSPFESRLTFLSYLKLKTSNFPLNWYCASSLTEVARDGPPCSEGGREQDQHQHATRQTCLLGLRAQWRNIKMLPPTCHQYDIMHQTYYTVQALSHIHWAKSADHMWNDPTNGTAHWVSIFIIRCDRTSGLSSLPVCLLYVWVITKRWQDILPHFSFIPFKDNSFELSVQWEIIVLE